LVSVIIPTYNAAQYIKDALESAFSQTYKNLEVIIIDDGSTDNTKTVIEQYAQHNTQNIHYIYQSNKGLSSARNTGIKASKGVYIAFLDSDDIWLPAKIECQMSAISESNSIGIIGCGGYFIGSNNRIMKEFNRENCSDKKDLLKRLSFKNIVSGGSEALVKRECLDKAGLFDETLISAEDWDMWLRIAKFWDIRFVEKPLVKIRVRDDSMSAPTNAEKMLNNELAVLKKHFSNSKFLKWNLILKMKTYASRYFYTGWAYYEVGDMINANKCLIKSFLYNPSNLFNKRWLGLILRMCTQFYEKNIKRRKILNYRRLLESSQWWTKEKLLEFQWQELKKLLKHAEEQVPYWQKVFKDLGITSEDIKSYSDFRRLPIVTKEDIRNNKNLMIARNYLGKTWTKSTGGSTGVPLELDYTPDSYDWRVAVSKRGYAWAGCEDGMKQAHIWGVAIGKVPLLKRIKENIYHRILRQRYYNCFEFDEKKMKEVLRDLNSYKPEIIVGYTNPLYNFAKFVRDNGRINFRPRAIISGAEKLHKFQTKEISEVFDCEVFNTYGSREFMLVASECEKHKGLHINVENLFVEIIKEDGTPAKSGEIGDIVITDLHNYGMPFIRYKIGDMAIASDRTCFCRRGLPMLEDVIGRSLDMIKTPEGRFVPGEFFPHLMKEFNWIKQFQVIQESLDNLAIKIVKNGLSDNGQLNFLQDEIKRVLGQRMNIDIQFVDEIPLTKSGKFRVTISNIGSIKLNETTN
jgi:phenylacetate-CoA ligase